MDVLLLLENPAKNLIPFILFKEGWSVVFVHRNSPFTAKTNLDILFNQRCKCA